LVIPSLLSRATRDATRSRQPSTAPAQHFLLHLPIMHQEVSISFYSW
jgi:hypothetical protein